MAENKRALKRVKVEQWDGSMACMMCMETIRVPGGEPDALQCTVCSSVLYHRECAGKWAESCPTCNRNTIVKWVRPAPPGPNDEIIAVEDSDDDIEVVAVPSYSSSSSSPPSSSTSSSSAAASGVDDDDVEMSGETHNPLTNFPHSRKNRM